MIRLASILLLGLALAASGQTSYVGAVDYANRAFGTEVVDASLWTTSNLRMWLPFAGPPTNAVTFDAGDCSPWRSSIGQTNVASQPVWTSGVMRFTGSNFLDCGSGILERRNQTHVMWATQPTSTCYAIADVSLTNGTYGIVIGTNLVRFFGSGASSNIDATVAWPTGYMHIAVSIEYLSAPAWRVAIYTNGGLAASGRVELASTPTPNRARLHGRWVSANAGSASISAYKSDDDRHYLTNLTPAAIGADYSEGLGRARP